MKNDSFRIALTFEMLESRKLLASISGTVAIDVSGNHRLDTADLGVANAIVWIDKNANGKLETETDLTTLTDEHGRYRFENLASGNYEVRYAAGPGLAQTSPHQYFGWKVNGATTQMSLVEIDYLNSTLKDLSPPTLNNRAGLIKTIDGQFFGAGHLLDSIVSIDPTTGTETLYPVTSKQFVAGLAYDPIMDEIYTLASDTEEDVRKLYRIDRVTGEVMPVSDTVPDIAVARGTSALSFNWITREIISYNNGNGTFFSYDLLGNARQLGQFSSPFPFYNLSFDGFRYITHRAAGSQIEFFEIDPYTATAQLLTRFDGATTGNAAEILAANEPHLVLLQSSTDDLTADFLAAKLALQQPTVTIAADSLGLHDQATGLNVSYPLPDSAALNFCIGSSGLVLNLGGEKTAHAIEIQLSDGDDTLEIDGPSLPARVDAAGGTDKLLPTQSMTLDLRQTDVAGFDVLDLRLDNMVRVQIDPDAVLGTSDSGVMQILMGPEDSLEVNRELWTILPPKPLTERRVHQLASGLAMLELSNELGWQNPLNKYDVNRDQILSAGDALTVINLMNRTAGGHLGTSNLAFAEADYVDVNGDNQLTPLDVLNLINEINAQSLN